MGEFELFLMAFPEDLVIEVIIASTNKCLDKPLSLQKWYVWIGCQFFMTFFVLSCAYPGFHGILLWILVPPLSLYFCEIRFTT